MLLPGTGYFTVASDREAVAYGEGRHVVMRAPVPAPMLVGGALSILTGLLVRRSLADLPLPERLWSGVRDGIHVEVVRIPDLVRATLAGASSSELEAVTGRLTAVLGGTPTSIADELAEIAALAAAGPLYARTVGATMAPPRHRGRAGAGVVPVAWLVATVVLLILSGLAIALAPWLPVLGLVASVLCVDLSIRGFRAAGRARRMDRRLAGATGLVLPVIVDVEFARGLGAYLRDAGRAELVTRPRSPEASLVIDTGGIRIVSDGLDTTVPAEHVRGVAAVAREIETADSLLLEKAAALAFLLGVTADEASPWLVLAATEDGLPVEPGALHPVAARIAAWLGAPDASGPFVPSTRDP